MLQTSDALRDAKPAVVLVTDPGTNEVLRIAYPSGKTLGMLAGFSEPQGACSDGAGHFWIANTGDSNVLEYSASGQQLATLQDTGYYPVGCAYDPKTGDLAVTNILSTSGGAGSVAIFAKAKGSPKIYSSSSVERIYFGAYAGSTGTLVVDGESSSSQTVLAALVNGKFTTIDLKGVTLTFPGSVAWSTKLRIMNVEDQEGGVLYHFKLNGTVTGTTTLHCGSCDVVNLVLFGGTILTMASGDLDVFDYPSGTLRRMIEVESDSEPIGLAISSAVSE